jgi:aromatic ring-cleaving dioxygenase
MVHQLGRLEKVDLRDVWSKEAGDFTPWLGLEENLALLGETIGLELELEAQEKNVGPFRADLLCKDTATDSWVLIENQLERTDHSHLGQLLTYAAGLNAVTIVWVASRFAEDHRAALDWLNEVTGSNINFFGLEIELWRIGGSQVAPKFNLASKPNDWIKSTGGGQGSSPATSLTETKLLQQEYWAALREYMLESNSNVKPTKPLPQHWMNFAIGRSYFQLQSFANTKENRIALGLTIAGPDAKPHFHLLSQERGEIEEEFGETLEWLELPERQESRIMLHNKQADPNDRDNWPEQHAWLSEKLETFDSVFRARIKRLDASTFDPLAAEELP